MGFSTIDLPENMVNQAKELAGARGFDSWEAYVRDRLAIAMDQDKGSEGGEDYGAPASLTYHSDEELKQMLLEGINSGPAEEMTDADWEVMRAEIRAKYRNTSER